MSKELVERVSELECYVKNKETEFNSRLEEHSDLIESQHDDITGLRNIDAQHTEKLKKEWVVVLTTAEYNRLTTAPEGAPYNENYKYPDILYFVVDYNRPKAIYIGDILIAKADKKGSQGFSYSFPISF